MISRHRYWLPITLITLGIAAMIFGLYRGEVTLMWERAVTICLECIGLG